MSSALSRGLRRDTIELRGYWYVRFEDRLSSRPCHQGRLVPFRRCVGVTGPRSYTRVGSNQAEPQKDIWIAALSRAEASTRSRQSRA